MRDKLFFLVMFLTSFSLFAQGEFKLLASSETEIVISYKPNYLSFKQSLDNSWKISVANTSVYPDLANNQPKIPINIFSIGVPAFGSQIEIVEVNYEVVDGKIELLNEKENFNQVIFQQNWSDFVENSSQRISRNAQIEEFWIFPIIPNSDNSSFKKLTEITFRIKYKAATQKLVENNDNLLSKVLLNFAIAKKWGIPRKTIAKANPSVLSSGIWHRTKITDEGIYKINYQTLVNLGFKPTSDNPKTIKIYNNGGYALNESFTFLTPSDLIENAISVVGEDDEVLNENDYVVFYGRGTDFFEIQTTSGKYVRKHNQFAKGNYYWITWAGNDGKRIANENSLSEFSTEQTTTQSFLFNETDTYNPLKSGRQYFGEQFSMNQTNRTFDLNFANIVKENPIYVNWAFVNYSVSNVDLNFSLNGNLVKSETINGYGTNEYSAGVRKLNHFTFYTNSEISTQPFLLNFEANSTSETGGLDFFEVTYYSKLVATDNYLSVFGESISGDIKYTVSNFTTTAIEVFDITNFSDVKKIIPLSNSGGEVVFVKNQTSSAPAKFILLNSSKYKTPPTFEKVENSFVRQSDASTKMVIITNKTFSEVAQEYADFRMNESKFPVSTSIFYIDEIQNEFSAGLTDPTSIRGFVKHIYDNWTSIPEYIFILGKGTYDYFGIEANKNNYVLAYHTTESLYSVSSYFTDDYYAWIDGNDSVVDLGIARLPIESDEDLRLYLQKIKDYENNQDFSNWRYKISLVADDNIVPSGEDIADHTPQSETLSALLPTYFEQNKIYLLNYPTVITGVGRRKPAVNDAIVEDLNNGVLLMNFIGHGNPDVWTDERVFMSDVSIPLLKNTNYFFLSAATCSFGHIDDPDRKAASEQLIFKENAGAIGIFASVRASYSDQNSTLNNRFYSNLLDNRDGIGSNTLGNTFFSAKSSYSNENTRKFSLICDPALRLLEPDFTSKIDSVSGSDLSVNVQIQSLSKMNVKGSVDNDSDFTGEALITVFDSERIVELPDINDDMKVQGGILFKGRSSVVNGKFETEFIVPQDISFENRNGKIIAYFYNDEKEAIGSTKNIIVGGRDTTQTNDGKGPEIEIALDDFSYENAYLVNPNFTLLAKLIDETGINTSGLGLGHKLEGIIDGDEENPTDFSNSFISDLDKGGTSGEINYKYYNFTEGEHSIKIKSWDVFNNASEKEISFNVVSGDGLAIMYVVNYPNPFSDVTYFTFQHNLTETIDVDIQIFSVAGRKIKQIEERSLSDKFVKIFWDGKDEDGDNIANGTYFYRLKVKSNSNNYSEVFTGKISVVK